MSNHTELWVLRIAGVLFFAVSAFGFTNAFVFKIHGPGVDLGLIAGALAIGALALARRIAREN